MAEWSCSGLQIRVRRFDSDLSLQLKLKFKLKKILVTGCNGFIGFHLVRSLLSKGFLVHGIDSMNDYYDVFLKKNRLSILKKNKNFQFNNINLCDRENLKKLIQEKNPSIIINLAAQAGVRYSLINPNSYFDSNLIGFCNIIEIAKERNIKFIYASSSSVYGSKTKIPFKESMQSLHPVSLYGLTKKFNEDLAENYFNLFGFKSIGLRFFTVYGPWGRPDMAYFKFSELIRNSKEIIVYNQGKMSRDMTFVDDVCDGILSSINYEAKKNEIFNLGNNSPIELKNLISFLENHFGKSAKIKYKKSKYEVTTTYADISKSKKYLSYNPQTNFEEGMKIFLSWFNTYKL